MILPERFASAVRRELSGKSDSPQMIQVILPTGEFTSFVDTRIDLNRVKVNRRGSTPNTGVARLVR
jgi:hypothetical protein